MRHFKLCGALSWTLVAYGMFPDCVTAQVADGPASSTATVSTDKTEIKPKTAQEMAQDIVTHYGSPETMTITADQLKNYLLTQMAKQSPNQEIDTYYTKNATDAMPKSAWTEIKTNLASSQANLDVIGSGHGRGKDRKMNLDETTSFLQTQGSSVGAGGESGAPDPYVAIFGKGLHLNQSSTVVAQQAQPAQLSWVDATHGNTSYNVDASLSYDCTPIATSPEIRFSPAVEAHISDNPSATQDSVSASAPVKIYVESDCKFWPGNYFYVGPTYQMDYKADTKTYGATFLYSPTIPDIGIGAPPDWNLGKIGDQSIDIFPSWRPYLGVESGYTEQSKPGNLRQGDFDRLVFQLHAQVFVTRYFELSGDYYHRYFVSDGPFIMGDRDNFDFVQETSTFFIDPATQHFSFGLTYKDGRSTPQFQRVQSLSAFVGVKF